jgi:uncharacterized membrane protein
MSREERRAYQRMMKSQERGPALPPAAKARAERNAARRAARKDASASGTLFSTTFWVRSGLIAAALGFVAFSLQWPNMPFALYVGLGVAVLTLALVVGFRLLQRRATGPAPGDGPRS